MFDQRCEMSLRECVCVAPVRWNLWAWRQARKRWAVPLATLRGREAALSRLFAHWSRCLRLGRRAAQARDRHVDRHAAMTGFVSVLEMTGFLI